MALTPVQITPVVLATTTVSGTITLTFGSPTTVGNTLIVCFCADSTTTNPTVSGVTIGGHADSFALVKGLNGSTAGDSEIWYDPTMAFSSTSVVVSYSGGVGAVLQAYAVAYEIPGTLNIDKTSSNQSVSSSTWTSGTTATTTVANEIFIGSGDGATALTVTGAGSWTSHTGSSSTISYAYGYQIVASTGTCAYSGTISSAAYSACCATFWQTAISSGQGLKIQRKAAYGQQ